MVTLRHVRQKHHAHRRKTTLEEHRAIRAVQRRDRLTEGPSGRRIKQAVGIRSLLQIAAKGFFELHERLEGDGGSTNY